MNELKRSNDIREEETKRQTDTLQVVQALLEEIKAKHSEDEKRREQSSTREQLIQY